MKREREEYLFIYFFIAELATMHYIQCAISQDIKKKRRGQKYRGASLHAKRVLNKKEKKNELEVVGMRLRLEKREFHSDLLDLSF